MTAATSAALAPASLAPEFKVLPHHKWIAASVGLAAALWLFSMSGWLGVKPHTPFTDRQNVLFNSDTNIWMNVMAGDAKSPELVIHPLELVLYRPPTRVLFTLFAHFMPVDDARVVANRVLVAVLAGMGFGFMAYLALACGLTGLPFALAFAIYSCFTCNSTIVLPEHFGISSGLLTVTFVLPLFLRGVRSRIATLAVMAVLDGGTTVTNALFPMYSAVHYFFRNPRARLRAALALSPLATAAALFLYKKSYIFNWFMTRGMQWRIYHKPLSLFVYGIYTFAAPAVGPLPLVLRLPGWDMVSYEPAHVYLRLQYYFGWQVFGFLAWAALLVICTRKALRDPRLRAPAALLLAWLIFSAIFHNFWGDELVQYAPHWSWALMGLVVMGAPQLSRRTLALLAVPILACQIHTLLAIRAALQTITR